MEKRCETKVVPCPICGSGQVSSSVQEQSATVPYGPIVTYQAEIFHCANCDERGDFDGRNDDAIERAYRESRDRSVAPMLAHLKEKAISAAYFERALALPQGSLARWKTEGCSDAEAALLRLVRTYPWLLEVADGRYVAGIAERVIRREVGSTFDVGDD